MAGYHPGDPLSLSDDPAVFANIEISELRGTRIAWWTGLGGIPFQPEIVEKVNSCRPAFNELGCLLEDDEPDFTGIDDAFLTLRHLALLQSLGPIANAHPGQIKDTIQWELERANSLSSSDIARALARQNQMYAQAARAPK